MNKAFDVPRLVDIIFTAEKKNKGYPPKHGTYIKIAFILIKIDFSFVF